jgi:hypothetical protein
MIKIQKYYDQSLASEYKNPFINKAPMRKHSGLGKL